MTAENRRSVYRLIKRKGFKQFISLCTKYKRLYLTVLLLQFGATATSLLTAEASRRIFNGGRNLHGAELPKLIVGLAIFVSLGLVFSLLSNIFNQIVNTNVVFQMRQMVLRQLTDLSLSYHEGKHSSDAKNLMFNELGVFKDFVVFDVLQLISLPCTAISVGVYLITINPLLGIAAVLVGPLQFISNVTLNKVFKELIAKQQAFNMDWFFYLTETLAGIREVKMNQLEKPVQGRFGKLSIESIVLWISIEKLRAFRGFIQNAPQQLAYLVGIGFGAVLMVKGQIGPGALVAFITLLGSASTPFSNLVGIINSLQTVSAGAEKLLDLMEMETEDRSVGIKLPSNPPSVEFKNITFAYDEGNSVLKNISFNIPPGKSVALVGPSGGGKSTLVKLLYRFYTPQVGAIRINDIPIEQYSIDSLRSNLTSVSQDVYLFDGTIYENIAIGSPESLPEEIYRAAVLSESYEFIMKLPQGFETRVGERGIKLSQGQKQRIAIARSILRKASIIILDEPTSALDVETELMFQKNLHQWAGDTTKIIIAHRLSTIRDVDFVLFLEDGKIQEFGSPRELINQGGRFTDFWETQHIREFLPASSDAE